MEQYGGERAVVLQPNSYGSQTNSYFSQPSSGSRVASPLLHTQEFQETFLLRQSGGSPSLAYPQQQPVMFVQQQPVIYQPMITTTRRLCGIGCVIERNRENQCVVAKVLPGGASDGLVFVGDIIDEVDNVPTDRIPVAETPQRFMGEVGSFVNLGVVSRSTGRRVVTIQRRSINALNSSSPTSAYRSTVRSTSPYSVRSASPSARSVLRQSSYNSPSRPEPAPACTVS